MLAGVAGASPAVANDGLLSFAGAYQPQAEPVGGEAPSASTADAALAGDSAGSVIEAVGPAFGEVGHRRWQLSFGTGVGFEAEDSIDPAIAVDVSVFVAPDFEVAGELSIWYFAQDFDDAVGLSGSIVFRYHYINNDTLSAFFEAGIGPMIATDTVPQGGTGLNFIPRFGLGLTFPLGDSGTRLVTGVRWHHISNARINGETRNPDRDGVYGWVGLSFPF